MCALRGRVFPTKRAHAHVQPCTTCMVLVIVVSPHTHTLTEPTSMLVGGSLRICLCWGHPMPCTHCARHGVCLLSRCCGWESGAVSHSTCSLSPLQHLHAPKRPLPFRAPLAWGGGGTIFCPRCGSGCQSQSPINHAHARVNPPKPPSIGTPCRSKCPPPHDANSMVIPIAAIVCMCGCLLNKCVLCVWGGGRGGTMTCVCV